MIPVTLLKVNANGHHWDSVSVDSIGWVQIKGWSEFDIQSIPVPQILADGVPAPLVHKWRYLRPDVSTERPFLGFGFEFMLEPNFLNNLVVRLPGLSPRSIGGGFLPQTPHYVGLLKDQQTALKRDKIYGSGLPHLAVPGNVQELTALMNGSILDFGCGSGALVAELRRQGKEAFGVEIDRPVLRRFLNREAEPYVTFYDGNSIPFTDGRFDTVVALEVLEHVPDFESALREISRVGRRFICSVPDMALIPRLWPYGVVPWHLLESTHLNFFTTTSLTVMLRRFFKKVEMGRISPIYINGFEYFLSLVATCDK